MIFLADYQASDGSVWCLEFERETIQQAIAYAEEKGWTILGTKITELDCPAQIEAMIEKHTQGLLEH